MKEQLTVFIPQIRKALVAGFVTVVLSVLARYGIDSQVTVEAAVTSVGEGLVAGLLVWLVPNKK